MRAIPFFYYSILIGRCLLLTCDKYDQSAERDVWNLSSRCIVTPFSWAATPSRIIADIIPELHCKSAHILLIQCRSSQ